MLKANIVKDAATAENLTQEIDGNDEEITEYDEDISDTVNLADSRGGHAHVCADWALRHAAHVIEDVIERVHVHLCAIDINIDAIPMPSTPLQSCIL